jgi:hypothetical protein
MIGPGLSPFEIVAARRHLRVTDYKRPRQTPLVLERHFRDPPQPPSDIPAFSAAALSNKVADRWAFIHALPAASRRSAFPR